MGKSIVSDFGIFMISPEKNFIASQHRRSDEKYFRHSHGWRQTKKKSSTTSPNRSNRIEFLIKIFHWSNHLQFHGQISRCLQIHCEWCKTMKCNFKPTAKHPPLIVLSQGLRMERRKKNDDSINYLLSNSMFHELNLLCSPLFACLWNNKISFSISAFQYKKELFSDTPSAPTKLNWFFHSIESIDADKID